MEFNYAPETTDSFKKQTGDTIEFSHQPLDEPKNLLDFLSHEKTSADGVQHVGDVDNVGDTDDDDDSASLGATTAIDNVKSELHPPRMASDANTGSDQPERIDDERTLQQPHDDDDDAVCKRARTEVEENETTNVTDSHASDAETKPDDDDFLKITEETRSSRPDHASDEYAAMVAESHKAENSPAGAAASRIETTESTVPIVSKGAEPSVSIEATPAENKNLAASEERTSLVIEKSSSEIGPKDFFSKYGLDTWFRPECLNPTVEAFIYWRDPKLSGIIFGSGLVLLLSLAYFSFISVVANTALGILICSIVFRIYKDILQAVQKSPQTHPYSISEYLHSYSDGKLYTVFLHQDIKLPQEKVHELVDTLILHINACIGELRRLFLVEDMIESLKFALVLWVLTYVGSWFNGLTLVILAFVSLFTLPKVYENNKVQIDHNLALVRVKLEELTNKIKDALPAPLRRKLPEKKE